MDDLIRRSDAIEETHKRIGADLDIDDVEYFEKIINSVPTAYNRDKVLEEMNTLKNHYRRCCLADYNDGAAVATEECMGIVRIGGVNG